jgi:hypothetical protein
MKKKQRKKTRKWSSKVTMESFSLNLSPGIFTWKDPKKIARSLKQSAEESFRKKGTSFQAAMSMLSFYINRAGINLNKNRLKILNDTKVCLRKLFGRN